MQRAEGPGGFAPVRWSRTNLSRERIAAAALEIVDTEGLDALTMRRLAEQLEVGTMTLYRYFPEKEQLLDAVIEAAEPDELAIPDEGIWRDRLRAVFVKVHDGLLKHPGLTAVRHEQPFRSEAALRISEAALSLLVEAGFDTATATSACRALFTYTFGFAAFGAHEASRAGLGAAARAAAAVPEDYPTLAAAAPHMAGRPGDRAQFEFGLDRLLDGLEAFLESRHT